MARGIDLTDLEAKIEELTRRELKDLIMRQLWGNYRNNDHVIKSPLRTYDQFIEIDKLIAKIEEVKEKEKKVKKIHIYSIIRLIAVLFVDVNISMTKNDIICRLFAEIKDKAERVFEDGSPPPS